jgi:putative SOS response-associated peptidase YedK
MAPWRGRQEKSVPDQARRPRDLRDRSIKADGDVIESCALIPLPGNEPMRRIHNTGAHPFRMPALLAKEDRERWLMGSAVEAKAS